MGIAESSGVGFRIMLDKLVEAYREVNVALKARGLYPPGALWPGVTVRTRRAPMLAVP